MNDLSNNPIGLFDSGMGGLTVAKTLAELMPNEHMVYFGDTAHAPWGDKSTAAIQAYCIRICEVLLQHHCKLIVIACHTASTAANELVREYVGNKAKVINVVDPIIDYVKTYHQGKKIGLIGTKQTIRSNTYMKRIDELKKNIELASLATPLLVPLIEEGFADRDISEIVINEYLSKPSLTGIQALILGCTHYPLIKNHISRFYQNNIDIIDASKITSHTVKEHLEAHHLINSSTLPSKKTFYVSDLNEFFTNTTKIFFPGEIKLEPYPLWE